MIPIMINDVSISCINHAAIIYHVPATIILSVMKKEGGRNGAASVNKNGTIDYGVMQINSIWLAKIVPYGYTKEDLQFNACKNITVATWIIAQGLAQGKSSWSGVANYHSRTKIYNEKYSKSIYETYRKMNIIFISSKDKS
jgi:soluble lytic murein transglycosylase-like protein